MPGFGLIGRFDELTLARQLRDDRPQRRRADRPLPRGRAAHDHAQVGRAILNVASTAAFQPGPNMAVYFATKAYVLSFSEALHEELKTARHQVSAPVPGPTRTEFGEVAGFGGNGLFDRVAMDAATSSAPASTGLDKNRAVVVPGC